MNAPEQPDPALVRPLRKRVTHSCDAQSEMQLQQAEDMARDPQSWSTCWCMVCGRRLPVNQFKWTDDGTPVGS